MNMTEAERQQAIAEIDQSLARLKDLGVIRLSTDQHFAMTDVIGHLLTAKSILVGNPQPNVFIFDKS